MDIVLVPLVSVILIALNIYWWAIIIYVVLGWLEQFNVINRYNNFVYSVHTFLFRVVEPALTPIRRLVPSVGGMDISPLILLLLLYFVRGVLLMLVPRII